MERKSFKKIKRAPSEYEDKVVEIRRVTRVVAGGKRFSFRATVVVGNRNGKIGVGIGKGLDVSSSIEKGRRQAEKNVFLVPLKEKRTIPYEIDSKYGASRIRLRPAKIGHGLIAGGSCRVVLELAGVKDITGKILGRTTNKLTNALATVKALKEIKLESSKPVANVVETDKKEQQTKNE